MEGFVERINKALALTGYRPSELSERSGIDRGSISHYLKGDYKPAMPALRKLAAALNVTVDWLLGKDDSTVSHIPVIGKVAAGVPIYAQEDIIGSIPVDSTDGLFALRISGDSMSPRILDGDVVVVRQQDHAADGDLIIALVDDDATCKVLHRSPWGISLVPFNQAHQPIVLAGSETDRLHILGVVVEHRHKWQ